MIRIATVAAAIFAASGFSSLVPAAEVAPRKSIAADELRSWMTQLNHVEFKVRESAERKLIASGATAVPHLVLALENGSAEAAWRCAEILEQIAVEGDEATLERVSRALNEINAKGKRSFARLVDELQQRQKAFRHDRAIALFRKQGGKIGASFESDAPLMAFAAPEMELELDFAPVAGGRDPDDLFGDDAPLPELIPGPVVPVEEDPGEEKAVPLTVPERIVQDELPAFELPALTLEDEEPLAIGAVEVVPGGIVFGGGDAIIFGGGEAFEGIMSDDALAGGTMQLGPSWKGGDAGLAVLRELQEVMSLQIENAPITDAAFEHIAALKQLRHIDLQGSKVTAEGLRAFRAKRSDVSIMAKGPAMMGVSANWQQSGCTLNHVFPGSGASEAGLQEGDEIFEINGKAIRDFTDLTISVFASKPGEKIKVKYRRGNQTDRPAEVELKARRE